MPMVYKDMTFCSYYEDCAAAKQCHRPLTPEVRRAAEKAGMYIAQLVDKPDCWKEKAND